MNQAIALKESEREESSTISAASDNGRIPDAVSERAQSFAATEAALPKQQADETDSDADPEFEYSAESIAAAKTSDNEASEQPAAAEEATGGNENNMENDEDLVQLDDDDAFAENEMEEHEVNQNSDQLGTGSPPANGAEKDAKGDDKSERPERSLTPCLDEQQQEEAPSSGSSGDESAQKRKRDRSAAGIEGMDTELISEDENENLLLDGEDNKPSKGKDDKENNNKSRDKDDSFKKISKSTKERHYRDKRDSKAEKSKRKSSRSRSKSRSRSQSLSLSRSRSKSPSRHRGRRSDRSHRRDKRQEIQRYDVRNLIAERQPRQFKDKYGRDTSRPARSPTRSPSPRRRKSRSASPKIPAKQRSRRRSVSRNRSVSRRRSPSRRRSLSRRQRSVSPRQRRRRSASRSPARRVSPPANYYAKSRSRSLSLRASPIRHHHHHHRQSGRSSSRSRSRSRSKVRGAKTKKKADVVKKSKARTKKKSASNKKASPYRSPSAERHVRSRRSHSRSWNRDASWSRLSPANQEPNEVSWTPPIVRAGENLTVILKNKDTGTIKRRGEKKKKKGEKRKRSDSQARKEKRSKQRPDASAPAQPSKEVFASGDNILVSVSFNKEKQPDAPPPQQTTIVTLPPSKDQILSKKASEREPSRRSRRANCEAPRKHKKVDIKPVAIIDLDNSPFKEITPSPKAVIVLSDSDQEIDKSSKNKGKPSKGSAAAEADRHEENAVTRVPSPPQSPMTDAASYELSLGPKTPPEPHLVKFSISSNAKNKVRGVANPLHDENDDEDDAEEANANKNTESSAGPEETVSADKLAMGMSQSQQKVGPNTPPESGPCSPDAYDPFEPTKSPSQSPNDIIHSANSEMPSSNAAADDPSKQAKPVDLKIAFISSKASLDSATAMLNSTLEGDVSDDVLIIPDEASVSPFKDAGASDEPKASGGIHVVSNILITSGKDTTTRVTAHQTQTRASTLTTNATSSSKTSATPSKASPVKFGSSLISKLPLPPKPSKSGRHNGNDDNMDIESPYSPGSSDYEDLFEPPPMSPPANSLGPSTSAAAAKKHASRTAAASSAAAKPSSSAQSAPKEVLFDDLFGFTSPVNKSSGKAAAAKRQKHKRNSSIKGLPLLIVYLPS